MGKVVGIDLGTTYSAIAVISETGKPEIKPPLKGGLGNLTPSYVLAEEDGTLLVGEVARKTAGMQDGAVAYRFKREMGTSKTYSLHGREFTPTELSAAVLKKIKQDFESQEGEISEAVISVPANFANEAREATLEAARSVGLDVRNIVNEPTAAALYYIWHFSQEGKTPEPGKYAVYDLGGGTFDISIVEVNGQDAEVVATNGIHKLGGVDFDNALRDIAFKKFEEKVGEKCDEYDYLPFDAEGDKKSLSEREKVKSRIGGKPVELARVAFEERISGLISQTVMECEGSLEEAGCAPEDIRDVFMVGGSTRVPAVREAVRKVFGKEPKFTVNVDEAVVLGAALYAGMKSRSGSLSAVQQASLGKLALQEITSQFFGIVSLSRNEATGKEELRNSIIVRKNEQIPCSRTEDYYTNADGQTQVKCRVTESIREETDLKFVKVLAETMLPLPPGRPAGQRIEVTYSYTENQTLFCTFKDVETGEERKLEVKQGGDQSGRQGISIEEIVVE